MSHGCKAMPTEIGADDVIDKIIKSKSISTFLTAVTWLIFQLERRTKAQNVMNWTRCCTNFSIFTIITVVIIMLLFIINLEILASTQSPIAFSFFVYSFPYVYISACAQWFYCMYFTVLVIAMLMSTNNIHANWELMLENGFPQFHAC